jgi:cobalt-zinc-cadmium efflux system protein
MVAGKDNERAVFLAFLLTAGYMGVEFVGGYISGSLALVADASHMLVDAGALLLSLAGFRFGRKKPSPARSFGYMRFEILASLGNSISLFALAGGIMYNAVRRLITPREVHAESMLVVAAIGLIVNVLVLWILSRGERNHLNIKGAMMHVAGDMMGSVAAIAAALIIHYTGWTPADSALSMLVSLLLIRSAWRLFAGCMNILMEGAPPDMDVEKVRRSLLEVDGVEKIGHIHIWSITSGRSMAALDIGVAPGADIRKTCAAVKTRLESSFGIFHSTVGVDCK